MKPSILLVAAAALSSALFTLPALADDTAAPAASTAPAAAAPAAKAKKVKAVSHGRGKGYYEQCLKENLADAEYFCSKNPSGCQAEKDGAAAQCRSEAKGEHQKG